jgi:hypothetical protein
VVSAGPATAFRLEIVGGLSSSLEPVSCNPPGECDLRTEKKRCWRKHVLRLAVLRYWWVSVKSVEIVQLRRGRMPTAGRKMIPSQEFGLLASTPGVLAVFLQRSLQRSPTTGVAPWSMPKPTTFWAQWPIGMSLRRIGGIR